MPGKKEYPASDWRNLMMTEPERSPLARFMIVMVCLALAGSIAAGVLSVWLHEPAPPQNSSCWDAARKETEQCNKACDSKTGNDQFWCKRSCGWIIENWCGFIHQ
jgi:hypothetical protein